MKLLVILFILIKVIRPNKYFQTLFLTLKLFLTVIDELWEVLTINSLQHYTGHQPCYLVLKGKTFLFQICFRSPIYSEWIRGRCRGLPPLPMQYTEMAQIIFHIWVFISKKTGEQDSQTWPKVGVGNTAASETLILVGGYNFSCHVFNTIRDSMQCWPLLLQLTYKFLSG